MSDFSKLELSDDSLVHLLNFILSMLKEDRQNALTQYDTLASVFSGPVGDGMDTIQMSLLLKDAAEAITGFLKNSAQSTDQAIKVAQLLANHLIKMDKSSTLTDEDRATIEQLTSGLTEEKKKLDNIVKIGGKK